MGGGYLHWGHIEMMRLTINRKMDSRTTFARWRINGPYKPITRKGLGQRMGGGKGAIDHYVTPVRYGRLIVEVGGKVELAQVEHILKEVAKKLPFPAKVRWKVVFSLYDFTLFSDQPKVNVLSVPSLFFPLHTIIVALHTKINKYFVLFLTHSFHTYALFCFTYYYWSLFLFFL